MATSAANTKVESGMRLTGTIVVVALDSAISGLLYGYDTGIISGALLQITDEFGIADTMKQVIAAQSCSVR